MQCFRPCREGSIPSTRSITYTFYGFYIECYSILYNCIKCLKYYLSSRWYFCFCVIHYHTMVYLVPQKLPQTASTLFLFQINSNSIRTGKTPTTRIIINNKIYMEGVTYGEGKCNIGTI